jgi:hypothetical protein
MWHKKTHNQKTQERSQITKNTYLFMEVKQECGGGVGTDLVAQEKPMIYQSIDKSPNHTK